MSQLTEDILSKIDIVDIVSRYVKLKKTGSNYAGLSPFQTEKTPSLMISPHKQIFKDFSSGIGGNAITFLMEIERIDFWDAIKILAEQAQIDLNKYSNYREDTHKDEKEKIKRIHQIAYKFFQEELHKDAQAQEYLHTQRKLDDNIIQEFGIGYAPDSHYTLVQELKKAGFSDQDIVDASLGKKGQTGDLYSFFRKRIIFPIWDTMHNIIGFGGRITDPNDNPKYLNSADHKAYDKSKTLYGLHIAKNYVKTHNALIIVEGYMDVIALYRLGLPIGVATCGTAITAQHVSIIKRYTDNVYFLFDNDKAGLQATLKGLKLAYTQNIFPQLLSLPQEYKDIDECANGNNGKEIFQERMQQAQDGFIAVFSLLKNNNDRSSPIGKQKVLNTLFELIMTIENINIQTHYLTLLAEHIGSRYEILYPQYKKFAKTEGRLLQNKVQIQSREQEYNIPKDSIIAALIYDDFLQQNIGQDKTISNFIKIIIETNTNVDMKQIAVQEIHQAQLRREKERADITDAQKKQSLIIKTIKPIIANYIKAILKNSNISHEQKAAIMQAKKSLGRL